MLFQCDCSQDGAGYENQFADTREVVARKAHECVECHDTIEKGERHTVDVILSHGKWERYRTCTPCARIRDHYCPGGFYFGMVAEHIEECLGFDYREVPEDVEDDE